MSVSRLSSVTVSLGAAALAFASSVAVYPWLPDRMPIHFDIEGHANGFAARAFGAFLLPSVMAVVALLGYALRQKNSAATAVTALTTWFMLSLHVLVLRAALSTNGDLGDAVWLALGAMFIGIGVMLPRVRRNRWVGVRTHWSMSSPEAWAQTHRAAGTMLVAGGAVLALSAITTGSFASALRVFALFIVAIGPIFFSWWIARRLRGAS